LLQNLKEGGRGLGPGGEYEASLRKGVQQSQGTGICTRKMMARKKENGTRPLQRTKGRKKKQTTRKDKNNLTKSTKLMGG